MQGKQKNKLIQKTNRDMQYVRQKFKKTYMKRLKRPKIRKQKAYFQNLKKYTLPKNLNTDTT